MPRQRIMGSNEGDIKMSKYNYLSDNTGAIQHQRLIKVRQAAQYLGISERKLWQLTKDRRVPAIKFDRVVRYDIADLDEFIAKAKKLA